MSRKLLLLLLLMTQFSSLACSDPLKLSVQDLLREHPISTTGSDSDDIVTKPIIFMHGIFNNAREPNFASSYIPSKIPGAKLYPIDMYNWLESVVSLERQVSHIAPAVTEIMNKHRDTGVTLLCFSQGGVICRALVQMLPDHNIHTLITLSSPLAGQFGVTSFIKPFLPSEDKEYLWRFFYTSEGQDISIGGYWNDPHHQGEFSDPSLDVLLARLNNQTGHSNSTEYKQNFLKLKQFVMVGGPNDTVITPWQSAHMGYYDSQENATPMEEQPWYVNDAFGLQTLDKMGRVFRHTVPGIDHIYWYRTQSVYDCCVLPHL